jgi:MFS superfamily sulfate permease-like transporter
MLHAWGSNVRDEVVGGLVSAAVAIPLAMGYGMFALVSLGDKYFTNGALAGLYAPVYAPVKLRRLLSSCLRTWVAS